MESPKTHHSQINQVQKTGPLQSVQWIWSPAPFGKTAFALSFRHDGWLLVDAAEEDWAVSSLADWTQRFEHLVIDNVSAEDEPEIVKALLHADAVDDRRDDDPKRQVVVVSSEPPEKARGAQARLGGRIDAHVESLNPWLGDWRTSLKAEIQRCWKTVLGDLKLDEQANALPDPWQERIVEVTQNHPALVDHMFRWTARRFVLRRTEGPAEAAASYFEEAIEPLTQRWTTDAQADLTEVIQVAVEWVLGKDATLRTALGNYDDADLTPRQVRLLRDACLMGADVNGEEENPFFVSPDIMHPVVIEALGPEVATEPVAVLPPPKPASNGTVELRAPAHDADKGAVVVTVDGEPAKEVAFTWNDWLVLEALVQTRDEITSVAKLRELSGAPTDQAVRSVINRLNTRVAKAGFADFAHNAPRRGYRLNAAVVAPKA